MRNFSSLTNAIIQYVKEHPGAKSWEILTVLPEGTQKNTVQGALNRLSRGGVLENRGGSANRFDPALWYYVESSASDYSQELARNIYSQMIKLPLSKREIFLAEKLNELLEAPRSDSEVAKELGISEDFVSGLLSNCK
jgi:hypothetical protein